MPIKHASIKDLRKSSKRATRNLKAKRNLDYLVTKSLHALVAKDAAKAKEWVGKSVKALDKAAQAGIIKKQTAARKKSRLMKKFNFLSK